MGEIAERLLEVRGRVEAASKKAGRAVDLMVVSKTWPSEVVAQAVEAGHRLFGENRLQEAEVKIPELGGGLDWHFIGGLQSNKVRKVLSLFSVVHSVSSMKLVRFVDRIAGELAMRPRVFLEVNIGLEESKHGFRPDDLIVDLEEIMRMENVDWRGLMCLPPRSQDVDVTRGWFRKVRELQEDLELRSGKKFPELSMGMSGDYELAIEEGSTIVRVGSAIFGARERRE